MSDNNPRPTGLEILGKVLLIMVALAIGAALLGALVIGACALVMK